MPQDVAGCRNATRRRRIFALGNRDAPTDIRDTPKVIPITPKVILVSNP